MEEGYEVVKELGAGNLGVARLVRDKSSKELIAVKCIERGKKMDENVQREIINHRSLRHPNIIRFKEMDENVQREIINHRSLRHPNIIRFKEIHQTAQSLSSTHKLIGTDQGRC